MKIEALAGKVLDPQALAAEASDGVRRLPNPFPAAEEGFGGALEAPPKVEFAGPATGPARLVPSGKSFGETLQEALRSVEKAAARADDRAVRFARGEPINVHDVVLAAEQARMAVLLVSQVRNRALEAWQELIRTSV